jgi:serine/threonine-protein kinase
MKVYEMFCGQCGEENADGLKFCTRCGANLREQTGGGGPAPGGDELDMADTVLAGEVRLGQVLAGQYELAEKIGAGGMGVVWRARDRELDTPVAVKVLPAVVAGDERSIQNLKDEAKISLRLTHPNICRLHGFHSAGSVKFLVMEYIDGRTLEEILAGRDGKGMEWEEVEPIAGQIAEALDYAHGLEPPVLHRDIKPSNIMVTPGGRAKLLDFGVAREVRSSLSRLTGMQDTSGTVPYMSPEQFRGGGSGRPERHLLVLPGAV